MTIRKRLARSNLVMILIPVAIAAVLLALGGGLAAVLLKRVHLPRLGLSAWGRACWRSRGSLRRIFTS